MRRRMIKSVFALPMSAHLSVAPKFRPALDPEFLPASLWNRAYRALAHTGGASTLAMALERSDGGVSVFRTAILPHEGAHLAVNQRYTERLLKYLLWQKGGWRITIAGEPRIAQNAHAERRRGRHCRGHDDRRQRDRNRPVGSLRTHSGNPGVQSVGRAIPRPRTLLPYAAIRRQCGRPGRVARPVRFGARRKVGLDRVQVPGRWRARQGRSGFPDRKSTRLNSSHLGISYAVFCLKKKTNTQCKNDASTLLIYTTGSHCQSQYE